MKIFIFTMDYPPNAFSGVATYCFSLCDFLKSSNNEIFIIHYLSTDFTDIEVRKYEDNLTVIRYPLNLLAGDEDKDYEVYSIGLLNYLDQFINKKEKIVFHLNTWSSYYIINQLKLRYTYPIVFTFHALEWQFVINGNFKLYNEFIENDLYNGKHKKRSFLEKSIAQEVDSIIVVSKALGDLLKKSYKISMNKIQVIHNGIKLFGNNKIAKSKSDFGFNKKERLIVYAGRLHYQKGLPSLINAFKLLLKKEKNVRLVIIGHGDYDYFLNQCRNILQHVTFTGFMNSNEIHEIFKIANMGVVPSIFESFGYVAVEMMAAGLPVIASAVDGLNEVITDNVTGLGIKILSNNEGNRIIDENDLFKKMTELLNNPIKCNLLSKNAFLSLKNKFNLSITGEKTLSLYSNILDKKSRKLL